MSINDDVDDKRETAVGLLLQVGALSKCPFHDDETIDGGEDIEGAYKLAMSKWSRGEHPEFANAREFTDYIKLIYEEYAGDECGRCDSVRNA